MDPCERPWREVPRLYKGSYPLLNFLAKQVPAVSSQTSGII